MQHRLRSNDPLVYLMLLAIMAVNPPLSIAFGEPGFFGDCTVNGAVDSNDVAPFVNCLFGPGVPISIFPCICADLSLDLRADLRDVAQFQRAFGLPVDSTGGVCGRGSGNCFEGHATPGCSDAACCSSVCATDPFCCTETWDSLCAQTAATVCAGGPKIENDSCKTPQAINSGTTQFETFGATTDGPNDGGNCATVDIGADLWFTYHPTCDGVAIVSLCGSDYDTTVAVYNGTGCPVSAAIGCSDDDCGFGLESRTVVMVTLDQPITIRIGGFVSPFSGDAATGTGQVTIICTESDDPTRVCGPGHGDCTMEHETPGCDDTPCCADVCGRDPFCCDVRWDSFCARESTGLCRGSFDTCGGDDKNPCNAAGDTAGCNDADCCNTVCQEDPYCCLVRWDSTCVNQAADRSECQ